jgi:hypothetical protein
MADLIPINGNGKFKPSKQRPTRKFLTRNGLSVMVFREDDRVHLYMESLDNGGVVYIGTVKRNADNHIELDKMCYHPLGGE